METSRRLIITIPFFLTGCIALVVISSLDKNDWQQIAMGAKIVLGTGAAVTVLAMLGGLLYGLMIARLSVQKRGRISPNDNGDFDMIWDRKLKRHVNLNLPHPNATPNELQGYPIWRLTSGKSPAIPAALTKNLLPESKPEIIDITPEQFTVFDTAQQSPVLLAIGQEEL